MMCMKNIKATLGRIESEMLNAMSGLLRTFLIDTVRLGGYSSALIFSIGASSKPVIIVVQLGRLHFL